MPSETRLPLSDCIFTQSEVEYLSLTTGTTPRSRAPLPGDKYVTEIDRRSGALVATKPSVAALCPNISIITA
eukprot:3495662-Ditylum_brightwellii.AAC.1